MFRAPRNRTLGAARCLAALGIACGSVSVIAQTPGAQPRAAEILRATGTVEVQHGAQTPWTRARSGQELLRGDLVRTSAFSIAQLAFQEGVQWQLAAESQLNLEQATAGGASSIIVRLERGGAVARWTPDRRTSAPTMIVKTAGGQASITGTEWSMRVDEDGRTVLLVLDGSVELSNERGGVMVHQNEAAEMRPGLAPSILRLIAPRDRVQWVASYAASPASYTAAGVEAGRTADALDRLEQSLAGNSPTAAGDYAAADLLLAAGEYNRARIQAEAGRAKYPADARFDALLARVELLAGNPHTALDAANAAIAKDARRIDGWLALGDVGLRNGDAATALRGFNQARDIDRTDPRGWFGDGTVATERGDFVPGRDFLNQALALDPTGAGYRGELGTLETLANRLKPATAAYDQALRERPDDYVALTGRALVALKEGREQDAIDLLLGATLLESRYARAHLYLAVAYYRLGRVDDARRELARTTAADALDPLPHFFEAMIDTDLFRPEAAMAAARTAQTKMPYLKSLNQVASTQTGSANLGNTFAFVGLEDWAQHFAQESYLSSWAGSHLFLGDRYPGRFNQNSEYFLGLATDPTTFGASTRFQTLLPRPGTYLTAGTKISSWSGGSLEASPYVTVNGFDNSRRPVAYFLNAETPESVDRSDTVTTHQRLPNATAAIGFVPTPQLSLFVYATDTQGHANANLSQSGNNIVTTLDTPERKVEGGVAYHFSPRSMIWAKASRSKATVSDSLSTRDESDQPFDYSLSDTTDASAYQFRHTVQASRHEMSWGAEAARSRELGTASNFSNGGGIGARSLFNRSEFVYAADRFAWTKSWLFDGQMTLTRTTPDSSSTFDRKVIVPLSNIVKYYASPRVGVVYRFGEQRLVRASYQDWVRPASDSMLAPVATAGIPTDDRLAGSDARTKSARVQVEWAWSAKTFTKAFIAREEVVDAPLAYPPLVNPNNDPVLKALSRIKNNLLTNAATTDLFEGEPLSAQSRLNASGVSINQVIGSGVSAYARYEFTPLEMEGEEERLLNCLNCPVPVPQVPRHQVVLGATWASPRRFYVNGQIVHRSERNNGGENWPADWEGTLKAYWELPSKRWSVEFAVKNLFVTDPNIAAVKPTTSTIDLKLRY